MHLDARNWRRQCGRFVFPIYNLFSRLLVNNPSGNLNDSDRPSIRDVIRVRVYSLTPRARSNSTRMSVQLINAPTADALRSAESRGERWTLELS